jgi:hypothetical protein
MPAVRQVSRPSALTSEIISPMASRWRGLGERQAAPMQKRVAPFCLAARAASITSSSGISFSAFRPVSK